jgi:chemotaxis protein MotB
VSDERPVIVVKRKKVVAAHGHSSAWKIAFADFAVAMMAFFLVLWLTEATSLEEQKAISGYFSDPVGFKEGGQKYIIDLGGSGDKVIGENNSVEKVTFGEAKGGIDAATVKALAAEIELQQFEALAAEIRSVIRADETLKVLEDQVELSVTNEGLQIQILDKESRPMFGSGSDRVAEHAKAILSTVGKTIAKLPNRISIAGHTDAINFTARRNYSNWELSADRANAARRVLQASGVREDQVTRVVGKGSSSLYLPEDPLNPINRRISILVLSKQREEDLKARFGGVQDPAVDTENFLQNPEPNQMPDQSSDSPNKPISPVQPAAGELGQQTEFGFDSFDASGGAETQAFEQNIITKQNNITEQNNTTDEINITEEPVSTVFDFDSPQAFDGLQRPQPGDGRQILEGLVTPITPEQSSSSPTGGAASFDFDPVQANSSGEEGAASLGSESSADAEDEAIGPTVDETLLPTAEDMPTIVEPEEKPWWEN